jgi:hypothetical protein
VGRLAANKNLYLPSLLIEAAKATDDMQIPPSKSASRRSWIGRTGCGGMGWR